jgi:hypothetical protein
MFLCEAGPIVAVSGSADLTFIEVDADDHAKFRCEARDLEDVLHGVPLQLSGGQGFLKSSLDGDEVVMQFALANGPTRYCRCSPAKVSFAIDFLRRHR